MDAREHRKTEAGAVPTADKPMTLGRAILIGCGWLSLAIGVVGIFVPVLPTTEFVMLAAFLFAKSSPRFHAWLLDTKVYRTYVKPFKETGGIPRSAKIQMIAVSMLVLAVSAFFVRIWWVWVILGVVALMILYMLLVRIPTRMPGDAAEAVAEPTAPADALPAVETATR